jgi:putative phage-type endonuclease
MSRKYINDDNIHEFLSEWELLRKKGNKNKVIADILNQTWRTSLNKDIKDYTYKKLKNKTIDQSLEQIENITETKINPDSNDADINEKFELLVKSKNDYNNLKKDLIDTFKDFSNDDKIDFAIDILDIYQDFSIIELSKIFSFDSIEHIQSNIEKKLSIECVTCDSYIHFKSKKESLEFKNKNIDDQICSNCIEENEINLLQNFIKEKNISVDVIEKIISNESKKKNIMNDYTPEFILCENKKDWLKKRGDYIGASNISSVMGLNEHLSRNDFLEEKLGIKKPIYSKTVIDIMKQGDEAEPHIIELFEKKTGYKVDIIKDRFFINPENPHLCATLDGLVKRNGKNYAVVECKFSASAIFKNYRSVIDPKINYYYPQIQSQMYIMGVDLGFFAVQHRFTKKTIFYEVKRDNEFIKEMIIKTKEFYTEWQKRKEQKNEN